MNKKLFVFDLDGTVLTTGDNYLKKTVESFKKIKEQNHFIAFATGRPLWDILRINKAFYENVDFFICNNGAYYYNVKTEEKTFSKFVPKEIAKEFLEFSNNEDCFFSLHTSENVFRTNLNFVNKELEEKIIKKEWNRFSLVTQNVIESEIEKAKITQVSLRSSNENIKKYFSIVNRKYQSKAKVRLSGGEYLDINPQNASKWEGIKNVFKEINVSLENVIAFGDSGNDVEMLENAKTSFSMENGTKEAKEVAKKIIGNNLTDAISETVSNILRGKND